jgi:hypothetical protein
MVDLKIAQSQSMFVCSAVAQVRARRLGFTALPTAGIAPKPLRAMAGISCHCSLFLAVIALCCWLFVADIFSHRRRKSQRVRGQNQKPGCFSWDYQRYQRRLRK